MRTHDVIVTQDDITELIEDCKELQFTDTIQRLSLYTDHNGWYHIELTATVLPGQLKRRVHDGILSINSIYISRLYEDHLELKFRVRGGPTGDPRQRII